MLLKLPHIAQLGYPVVNNSRKR